MFDKPYKGEIHDWDVVFYRGEAKPSIFGKPVGHPSFVNWILTSQFKRMATLDGETFVETQNSVYKLVNRKKQ